MNINELIGLGNRVSALSEIAGVINSNEEIVVTVKGSNAVEGKSMIFAGQARKKILNLVSSELQSILEVYNNVNNKLIQNNTNVDEVIRIYAEHKKNLDYGSQMVNTANATLASIDNLMNRITTELNAIYNTNPVQPTEEPPIDIPDESSSDEEAQPEEEDASVVE